MPIIVINKESEEIQCFGSLPILCKKLGFDKKIKKKLSYLFTQKKTEYNDENYRILKVKTLTGGKF